MKKNKLEDWDALYTQDMEQLGNLFEYAGNIKRVNMSEFTKVFMQSKTREYMDSWHAQFSNEPSVCLWNHFMEVDAPTIGNDDSVVYYPDELRWIGQAYAFLHYYCSESSKVLYSILDYSTMCRLYTSGHELSWERFADRLLAEIG